jgi:hypothetical protein
MWNEAIAKNVGVNGSIPTLYLRGAWLESRHGHRLLRETFGFPHSHVTNAKIMDR